LVNDRASENMTALEDLLAKVPEGQTSLVNHVNSITSNERDIKKTAKKMEEFSSQLKSGDINVRDGKWIEKKRKI
jgi:hypothetical protein